MVTTQNLNSFLLFGYFLDYKGTGLVSAPQTDINKYKDCSLNELIEIGSDLIIEIFKDEFVPNSQHLIPLSGGYDSRAILAGLLKFTESRNIKTYTYGIPGSYDFDIARKIAKLYGLHHYEIDFEKHNFTLDSLLDASKRFRHQTLLFFHPDYISIKEMFGDHMYWSGFLGGSFNGTLRSLKWSTPDTDKQLIKERFLKDNLYVQSVFLSSEPMENLTVLLDGCDINIDNLNLYEKLDLFNRQAKYTGPHVCPEGFNMIIPFGSSKWQNFICSIPVKFKIDMILYKKILLNTFPELFSLPTKNELGFALGSSNLVQFLKKAEYKLISYLGMKSYVMRKRGNYFDINWFIRNNKNMKEIVINALENLKKRNIVPWVDFEMLTSRHFREEADYGDALQTLASLELNLTSRGE